MALLQKYCVYSCHISYEICPKCLSNDISWQFFYYNANIYNTKYMAQCSIGFTEFLKFKCLVNEECENDWKQTIWIHIKLFKKLIAQTVPENHKCLVTLYLLKCQFKCFR